MRECLTIAMASAWVPPGDQLRQTWPHLGEQIWSETARQEVLSPPNWTQHLGPRPPRPHHPLTYFYWWFLCLEVLVLEVAVQPSTILAGHTENQLGSTRQQKLSRPRPQYNPPATQTHTSKVFLGQKNINISHTYIHSR